ncbi:Aspartyl protease [Soonwooa buanensis]|uniref:Aspartyl protease n=1 Tax=Soonwooa buanensis TaxID=619805 RepID=A0A1T5DLR1_9FLAO|nr:PDZ domain-containing protein [Soonwooa buanensis]SKB72618.1 Aspartyl protease [Soonwooa buanensis]
MKSTLILVFTIFHFLLNAQDGFQFVDKKLDKIEIKFVNVNNLIIIPINVNGVDLNFLLDTGVSETVLFSLENKEVNFKNVEKLKFTGLGENIDIEALRSINNRLSISNQFVDSTQSLNIILDESFNISTSLGYPVNGIIGYSFFKNYPIEVDYVSEKLRIYQNENKLSKRVKKHEVFNISLELNKPYMFADVEMTREKKSSKLLLDSGNTDSIWLFPTLIPGFNYNRPNIDDYLGAGFSGDIYGKRSRIHGLYFGRFEFITPLVAMPDATSIAHLQLVPDRKGSIGSEIFRRFNMVFDYPNEKVYFKKNKYYDDPFLFDLSGLEVRQNGLSWEKDLVKIETKTKNINSLEIGSTFTNTEDFQYKFTLKPKFIIAGTRKNSPAQLAGLQKGDILVKIDDKKTSDMTLSKINKILKSQEGKIIKIEAERNGTTVIYNITLKDPIPYEEH